MSHSIDLQHDLRDKPILNGTNHCNNSNVIDDMKESSWTDSLQPYSRGLLGSISSFSDRSEFLRFLLRNCTGVLQTPGDCGGRIHDLQPDFKRRPPNPTSGLMSGTPPRKILGGKGVSKLR